VTTAQLTIGTAWYGRLAPAVSAAPRRPAVTACGWLPCPQPRPILDDRLLHGSGIHDRAPAQTGQRA
jgi:hypothetical protein